MKLRPTLSAIAVLGATLLGACGGNRLLVGEGPDASPTGAAGTGQTSSGAAGTSSTPTGEGGSGVTPTGQGGSGVAPTGAAGAEGGTGAGGSVSEQVHPLQISGAEAISRIAQVLWQEAPDADLLLQAQQGHFKYTSDLYGAVHQMLVDPRAAKGVGAFYRWWLTLDQVTAVAKDPTLFPDFTALAPDMQNETQTFGTKVTLDENGSFGTLLRASHSYINERLAGVYNVQGVTGAELRMAALPPQRSGLLTQAALLVQGTNFSANDPTMRGRFLAEKFFCKYVPPPPIGENSLPTPAPGVTVRAALTTAVAQNASCTACHSILDPPGFVLENFDAIGRWRTMDNGAPVDTKGLRIVGLFDDVKTVDRFDILAIDMASAPEAQRCMARQWHAYVLAKTPAQVADALVDTSYAAFTAADLNLKALIVSVLTSDAFLANKTLQ
jgi:hypothetical protein